jgi:hypothetical protein
MADNQTSHITVAYQDGPHTHITCVYAIDGKTSRKLHAKKDWLGRQRQEPTGEALAVWLRKHACKLDSSDGPAYVKHYLSGTTVEDYYRDGQEHREDGPSSIVRRPDGSGYEFYCKNGQLEKALARVPNGTVTPISLSGPPLPRFLR